MRGMDECVLGVALGVFGMEDGSGFEVSLYPEREWVKYSRTLMNAEKQWHREERGRTRDLCTHPYKVCLHLSSLNYSLFIIRYYRVSVVPLFDFTIVSFSDYSMFPFKGKFPSQK